MRTRKRIIMIGTSEDSPGGMTTVVRTYRRTGLFETWNVLYLASYTRPGALTQLRMTGGVFASLLFALLRGNAAIVHLHSAARGSFWRKSTFAALTCLFRVPYIFHMHSGEFLKFYFEECGLLARWWVRFIFRKAAHVVVLTEGWRKDLARIEPNMNIVVLPNPIELPREKTEPGAAPVILFLGRLREEKGIYDLVAAMPHVLERFPRATFVCAGDGNLDEVHAAARARNVEHALVLPGWIEEDEKVEWLRRATVLTLPSHLEALGIALLEAMAYHVPVVATRVGGIPDLVQHEYSGLLVELGDSHGLGQAICRLLESPQLRTRLAGNAYGHVAERYAAAAVNASLGRVYQELGARRAAPAALAQEGGA